MTIGVVKDAYEFFKETKVKKYDVSGFLQLFRDKYAVIQDITFRCNERKYHLYFTEKSELVAKIHEMEQIGETYALIFD